ncbi:MAG: transcription antitermination factor NusB [Candidatus Krumholzibacteria bacterium]|nr:transcription antitermination factor NusB [Candidatus Krumholzibacteria bacterium]
MGKRRKAREVVLQVLYEAEFSDCSWEEILQEQVGRRSSSDDTVQHARALLAKAYEHMSELDEKIRAVLSNWDLERVSLIDKNIMRFALAEILFFPQVPSKVIINEAIEVAHKYSSREAGKFVNGILDRFVQTYRQDLI